MKRAGLVFVVSALFLCAPPQRDLHAGVTVEISREAAGVSQTATEKQILLVLPDRFFRAEGETAFSTPYIAELHYTTDEGETWESAGLFKELDKPFEFTAESEGRYGFFVTLVDQKGRSDITPAAGTPAQVRVLVDWTAPEVEMLAPKGGELIGGGDILEIKWSAEDLFLTEEPITIEQSADGGKTWVPTAEAIENVGQFPWKPPADFDGHVLFRVTAVDAAGHSTTAASAAPVVADAAAPQVALAGPRLASKQSVALEVSATDGEGSGVAELRLWVSHDGGVSWAPSGKVAAGQPLVFSSTAGTYGLFVTAVDRAGNASAQPGAGDAPQVFLQIDTKVPLVRLDTLNMGGTVRNGTRVPIQWEASAPAPAPRPVSVFLSPDGGNAWHVVAADLPNSGTYLWDVPAINSANCYLKVTVRDSSGTIGEAGSAKPFTVDSMQPTSAIGVGVPELSETAADLAVVLRELPQEPAEKEAVEKPAGTGEEDAGAAQAPGDISYTPEPTMPPSEPWTGEREEPYAAPPGEGADFEDLLKAGFAAYRAGRLTMAKGYFQRAVEINSEDPRPHAALGRIYAKMAGFNYTSKKEAFEAAVYEFEKALGAAGEDADTLNDLGCVLLQSKRYEDAEKTLRRATQTGAKAIYWCNLGMALELRGRDADALEAFLEAASREPEMREANFLLGKLYSRSREWEKARDHWEKAADGYGVDSPLGKAALSGLQEAREALGEISGEPGRMTIREKLDRVR